MLAPLITRTVHCLGFGIPISTIPLPLGVGELKNYLLKILQLLSLNYCLMCTSRSKFEGTAWQVNAYSSVI